MQIDVFKLLSRPSEKQVYSKAKVRLICSKQAHFVFSACVLTQQWQSLYPDIPRRLPGDLPVLQNLTLKHEIYKPCFCIERNNNVKDE